MGYLRESMIPQIGSFELRFKNEERMFLVIVTLSAASASNLGSCYLYKGWCNMVIWSAHTACEPENTCQLQGGMCGFPAKKNLWLRYLCFKLPLFSLQLVFVIVFLKSSSLREFRYCQENTVTCSINRSVVTRLLFNLKHKITKFAETYVHLGNSAVTTLPKVSWWPTLLTLVKL